MSRKVALVTGVGPGTGSAIVRRFAQGAYEIAMIARSGERLRELARDIPGTHAFAADVTDTHQMDEVLGRISRELGPPEIVIHNAVGAVFGNFQEIDPSLLERNFQVNVMALLHLVRRTAPAMIEAGRGAIIVTGNTSALRGKANFAGFAPTKAAQRVLAEFDRARARTEGHPCRLHRHRRRDRRRLDPQDAAGHARRLLHPAARHRDGGLARRASAAVGLVLQCRDQAVPRAVVASSVAVQKSHHFRGKSEMRTSEPKPHWANKLLVSFQFRSSQTRVQHNDANFGIGH